MVVAFGAGSMIFAYQISVHNEVLQHEIKSYKKRETDQTQLLLQHSKRMDEM